MSKMYYTFQLESEELKETRSNFNIKTLTKASSNHTVPPGVYIGPEGQTKCNK